MRNIITGLLLTLMCTVGWGEETSPSSCKVVFSCDSDSRYRFLRSTGEIYTLPQKTFVFWVTGTRVETDHRSGKFIFGDGTLPLELEISSCETVQKDVKRLAEGKTPIAYGFFAKNSMASLRFIEKKLSGLYLAGADEIDLFSASCSVVGTPEA